MELLILELIWWAILFLFFWGLRDARNRLQAEVESVAQAGETPEPPRPRSRLRPAPSSAHERIGTYQDSPIYRYVELDGRSYQFDRVCPPDLADTVGSDEVYLAPGLVYQECVSSPQPALQARR